MAELDAGLNIEVNAKANKKSAETAAQELEKSVISSLKDGYIEIPTEIKAPIKGASKELKQAQQDVLTQWKKTFSEGFSSSSQDMDELIKKYQKFKRLAKGKLGEDQTQWITKNIGTQIATYKKEQKKASENTQIQPKQTKTTIKTDTQKTKQSKKFNPDFGPKSVEEIDANIMQEFARKMNGIKSVLPKGFGTGWVKPDMTNDIEAQNSEQSYYKNNWGRQLEQSLKEAYAESAKTLVTYIDKELATADKDNKEVDRERITWGSF